MKTLWTAVVVPLIVASAWADYREAPMLTARVAAGELPPVEDRLPLEPKVRDVIHAIGTYGGQLIVFGNSPNPWAPLIGENPEGSPTTIRMNFDGSLEPDLAKSFSISDDYRVFTLTLREGTKWSNGDPFTAEDIAFKHNEMQEQDVGYFWSMTPRGSTVTAVDDLTVQIVHAEPYPKVMNDLVTYKGTDWVFYAPSTWLKQWHIEYNENADAKAKEEGFENWQKAFEDHSAFCCPQRDIERPTLAPFMLADVQPTFRLKERNPYYFAVDSAGQQLPYIDTGLIHIVEDREAMRLKVIGGEADYAMMTLDAYPLLLQGQQAGKYKLNLIESWFEGVGLAYAFNLNHNDPVKRQFYENVEFRRAISLAIDRERINEVEWRGQGTPSQMTITKLASIYRPEWGEEHPYARHDPDEANRMLDAIGLDERNADGIRLLPNGEPFVVVHAYSGTTPIRAYELVKEDFKAVGIHLDLRPADITVIDQASKHGDIDLMRWNETIGEFQDYVSDGGVTQSLRSMAHQYMTWWDEMRNRRIGRTSETGLLPGEEPPPELMEYFELQMLASKSYAFGSHGQRLLSSRAWELQSEYLWNIGVTQPAPLVMVYRENLVNVPDTAAPFFEGDSNFNYYVDQVSFAGPPVRPGSSQPAKVEFPWPPPTPTTRYEIVPAKLLPEGAQSATLHHVDQILSSALTDGRYFDRGYYPAPRGFVLVTNMEKYDCDNGISENNENIRWKTEYAQLKFVEAIRQPGRFIKYMFTGPPAACFRTIVFAVATEDEFHTDPDLPLSSDSADQWWNKSDRSLLPSKLHDDLFGESHIAVVLIYAFGRRGYEPLSFLEQSSVQSLCHVMGGGMSALLTESTSYACMDDGEA